MNDWKQILKLGFFYFFLLLGGAALFVMWIFLEFLNSSVSNVLGTPWHILVIILLILSLILPIWFLHKKRKGFKKGVALAVISFFFFTLFIFGVHGGVNHYIGNFTQEKWEKYTHERYRMLSSLEEQYNFIGMTKEEVTEILGEERWFGEGEDGYSDYFIGYPGLLDPAALRFEFSEGRVEKVYSYIEFPGDQTVFYEEKREKQ